MKKEKKRKEKDHFANHKNTELQNPDSFSATVLEDDIIPKFVAPICLTVILLIWTEINFINRDYHSE